MTEDLRRRINTQLLERIEPLARYLYPEGKKISRSWRIGSFDINLKSGCWGDWGGSTDRMSKNLIDLWLHARGGDFVTGVNEIRDWLGVPLTELPEATKTTAPQPEKKLTLPLLESPSKAELRQLAELRSLSVRGLILAVSRGFLWTYRDPRENTRAWLITDSSRKSAIGRRLDGDLWRCNGKKSKTLFGSWGAYPVGIADAAPYPAVGLVEGTPDFLAFFEIALTFGVSEHVAPVCMAGASMAIPESVLPRFAGKQVRIFIHDDAAGRRAAKRWVTQLEDVAEVDGFLCGRGMRKVDGEKAEDLNDLINLDRTSWDANREEIGHLMDFSTGGSACRDNL